MEKTSFTAAPPLRYRQFGYWLGGVLLLALLLGFWAVHIARKSVPDPLEQHNQLMTRAVEKSRALFIRQKLVLAVEKYRSLHAVLDKAGVEAGHIPEYALWKRVGRTGCLLVFNKGGHPLYDPPTGCFLDSNMTGKIWYLHHSAPNNSGFMQSTWRDARGNTRNLALWREPLNAEGDILVAACFEEELLPPEDVSQLWEWMPAIHEEGPRQLLVLDGKTGKALLHPEWEEADLAADAPDSLVHTILQQREGKAEGPWLALTGHDESRVRAVFRYLAEPAWIVVSWMDAKAAEKSGGALQKSLLGLFLLTGLLPAGFAIWWMLQVSSRSRRILNEADAYLSRVVSERTREMRHQQKQLQEELAQQSEAVERLRRANRSLNAELQEARQNSYEVEMLNKLTDLLQVSNSVDETGELFVQLARELFPEDSGGVFLFNEEQEIMECLTLWQSPRMVEGDFLVEDCWALRRSRSYAAEDVENDLVCRHVGEMPQNGYVCLPMMAQGELMGMIHFQWGPPDPKLGMEGQAAQRRSKTQLAMNLTEQFALALANLRLREMLRLQSIRDQLTGLYNRRFMEDALAREIHRALRREKPLAVIMVDLDHFKQVNDTYGHEDGDVLLSSLGNLLKTNIRREDIACRYGGEEFLVILPEADVEIALQRAELIRARVKSRLRVRDRGVTASLGVAIFPDHGDNLESLMNAADTALYQAKENGRDQVVLWQA